jgi:hypothetical protein
MKKERGTPRMQMTTPTARRINAYPTTAANNHSKLRVHSEALQTIYSLYSPDLTSFHVKIAAHQYG